MSCWKRAGIQALLCCALIGSGLSRHVESSHVLAQDEANPVAVQERDNRPAPTNFSDPAEADNDTQRLIIQTVRTANPQTPERIVKAANALLSVNAFEDVRYLLGRLERLQLDSEQSFQLIEQVGSNFFRQTFSLPELQPQGRIVASQILEGAEQAARDPQRVAAHVRALNSGDRSARRKAAQQLELLGEAGVVALINVFADAEREPEYPAVRQTLQALSQGLSSPLVGAARASHPTVKREAIAALAKLDSDQSSDVLMWCYLSPNHPTALRDMAQQALERRGLATDREQVEHRLFRRSYQYVMGEVPLPLGVNGEVTEWYWSEADQQMLGKQVDPATSVRLAAAHFAASLYEISPDSPRNRAIFLLTQLERAKRLSTARKAIPVDAVVSGLNTNPREINTVLAQAIRMELYPAAMACCEILGQTGNPDLLQRTDGAPTALIEAVTSGDRLLQYSAFDAITRLDPQSPYAGSSFVLAIGVYLAQSRSAPVALIGHRRSDVAQTAAASLDAVGLAGRPASSSRELFELATTDPDVQMILVSDTLSRPNYSDLIQQLRSDWRTRRLPIALVYSDIERGYRLSRQREKDERFISVPFTTDPNAIASYARRLNERVQPFQVSNVDRWTHARSAMDWLLQIALDRETYGFYEFGDHEEGLQTLLFVPGFEEAASQVLASLGTPAAQRQLVNFASQPSLPIDQRQRAAEAFARAVKQAGTLLTTEEIRQQYARLEASRDQPQASQQILAGILSTIEARAGNSE